MSVSHNRSVLLFAVGGVCAIALLAGSNGVTAAQKGGGGGGGGGNNAVPALQVIDSGGRVVGTLAGEIYAGRLVGNTRVFFEVQADKIPAVGVLYYFPTADCSGQSYVQSQHALLRVGGSLISIPAGGALTVVYPSDPIQPVIIRATQLWEGNGLRNPCAPIVGDPQVYTVGPSATLDVSGFTAPYQVQ